EELEGAVEIFDHHALQAIADEPREGGGELGGHLDAVGDDADERLVAGGEQVADALAEPLHPLLELFERAQAALAALQRVALGFELALAGGDPVAQGGMLRLEGVAGVAERLLLILQPLGPLGELAVLAGQSGVLAFEARELELESAAALLDLQAALSEAGEGRLGPGDGLRGRRFGAPELAELALGRLRREAQALELLGL